MERLILEMTKEKDELSEISLSLKNVSEERKAIILGKQETISSSLKEKIERLKELTAKPIIQPCHISIKKKAFVGTEVIIGKAEHTVYEDRAYEFRLATNGKMEVK